MYALTLQALHPASIPKPELVRRRNSLDCFFYQADKPFIFRDPRDVGLRIGKGQNLLRNVLCRVHRGEKSLTIVPCAIDFSESQAHEDLVPFGELPSRNQNATRCVRSSVLEVRLLGSFKAIAARGPSTRPFCAGDLSGELRTTRSGIDAVCRVAPDTDRHNCRIIYSGILEAATSRLQGLFGLPGKCPISSALRFRRIRAGG